jgi:hypothetical protein
MHKRSCLCHAAWPPSGVFHLAGAAGTGRLRHLLFNFCVTTSPAVIDISARNLCLHLKVRQRTVGRGPRG